MAADGEEDKQSPPYCKISGDEAAEKGQFAPLLQMVVLSAVHAGGFSVLV